MSVIFVPTEHIASIREEIGHFYSCPKNVRVPNRYSHVAPAGMRPCRVEDFTNGAVLVYLFDNTGHLCGYLYYPAGEKYK